MLQQYFEILKKATDAMTSLNSSGASVQDYLITVGYEFAVLGLGLLYLAVLALIVVIPILIIKKVICGNTFSTKKWMSYIFLRDKVEGFLREYVNAIQGYMNAEGDNPEEILTSWRSLLDFLKGHGLSPSKTLPDDERVIKLAKKFRDLSNDKPYDKLASYLPSINLMPEDFRPKQFYAEFSEMTDAGPMHQELLAIYPTMSAFKKACFMHYAVKIGMGIFVFVLYLILLVPFILLFF